MQSKASIKGHPIHPMLIVYPFAFLTGAFGFRAAAAASKNRELHTVADHLVPAGIAAGLLAAVPGLVDYLGSVPPASSGKERATKHALLNVGGLGLFAASWLLRRRRERVAAPLILQGLGTAAMSVAGYLGGTLVYRNQIGVDHRYADAGKWQEKTSLPPAEPLGIDVGSVNDLDVNQMALLHVGDRRVVLGR